MSDTPKDAKILELHLGGMTVADLAVSLDVSEAEARESLEGAVKGRYPSVPFDVGVSLLRLDAQETELRAARDVPVDRRVGAACKLFAERRAVMKDAMASRGVISIEQHNEALSIIVGMLQKHIPDEIRPRFRADLDRALGTKIEVREAPEESEEVSGDNGSEA